MVTIRVRSLLWFATGAVMALVASLLVMQAWRVDAAPGDTDTTFVPMKACRLLDTRPAPDRIGPHTTLGVADTTTVQARGTNGKCVIPAKAVGLSMNVTALNATQDGFLTFWPGGALPLAASLNPSPGQPPNPNAVTVSLSGSGTFNVYHENGRVDIVIDINGYHTEQSLQEISNRLLALERAQPFTVASAPISGVGALATATEIRNVTVTAPVDGHVAVIASGSMYEDTDGQSVVCGLVDTVTDPSGDASLVWQSPGGGDDSHLSASRVFDIAADATATYYLVCSNVSGGTSSIFSPQVTAIFTPAP